MGEGQDGGGVRWRIIVGQMCVCTHLLRIKRVNTGLCQHVSKNKVLETN